MKVLQVHNEYIHVGGEDAVVGAEKLLLISRDQQVVQFFVTNEHINNIIAKCKIGIVASYSKEAKNWLAEKITQNNAEIIHVHNFFPLLTPSIYDACHEARVPVVQTLHNYRIICTGALLMRSGKVCEQCIYGSPYQAVLYGCYRNSRLGSLAVARMIDYHRKRRTWQTKVDRFIALTHFAKDKFIEAGLPAEKISVKPNFYNYSGEDHRNGARKGALFVGRLSREKGIYTLLEAWQRLEIPLRIAGDGPLMSEVSQKGVSSIITLLGSIASNQVADEMLKALFLVMPSVWYEGFPMVLVEAFAHGLPVIASRLGSMAEIVEDGVTGLHFEAGNADDLAAKVKWMHEHPDECRRMGENARKVYEEKYTPERNYEMLMDIYQQAIDERKKRAD